MERATETYVRLTRWVVCNILGVDYSWKRKLALEMIIQ